MTPLVAASDLRQCRSQLRRTGVRSGVVSAKSYSIIVEMKPDTSGGNSQELPTTCSNAEYLPGGLVLVYLLDHDKSPLMPCLPAVASLLLKQGKAKCVRRTPLVIKLTGETTGYLQSVTFGLNTASGTLGAAGCKRER